AGALRVANAAPRFLIAQPGWTVVRADEFTPEEGEMTFANGDRRVDLNWRAQPEHHAYVKDRDHSSSLHITGSVLGHHADIFRYSGAVNDFTALWTQDDHAVELRGVMPSLAAFQQLLGSLHPVGVDEWLSAMPASVV